MCLECGKRVYNNNGIVTNLHPNNKFTLVPFRIAFTVKEERV